jgi:hypothetical protein
MEHVPEVLQNMMVAGRSGVLLALALGVAAASAACEATTVEAVTAVVEPECELFDESGQITPECSGVAECGTAIRDGRDALAAAQVAVGQACEALAGTLGLANTWEGLPERERVAQACGRARARLEPVDFSCSGCAATVTCSADSGTEAAVLAGVGDVVEACCDSGEAGEEAFAALELCGDFDLNAGHGLDAPGLCDDCGDRIDVIRNDALDLLTSGPCAPFLSSL